MKRRTTSQRERDDARRLCKEELARPENRDWPDFATVSLHAEGVLALLDELELTLTEVIRLKLALHEEQRARGREEVSP